MFRRVAQQRFEDMVSEEQTVMLRSALDDIAALDSLHRRSRRLPEATGYRF
ncbi:hypothetical protein [Mesorhizobium sp.]|uniref:hypothetical protein n=1 Tax=Mesorhizobium sp. TaxID=1871066 RepID=UPI002585E88C|nr:hypothetical protein [Mesorhizobium sp.]